MTDMHMFYYCVVVVVLACVKYYGLNCTYPCAARKCNGSEACDTPTGRCVDGCDPGWRGSDCVKGDCLTNIGETGLVGALFTFGVCQPYSFFGGGC